MPFSFFFFLFFSLAIFDWAKRVYNQFKKPPNPRSKLVSQSCVLDFSQFTAGPICTIFLTRMIELSFLLLHSANPHWVRQWMQQWPSEVRNHRTEWSWLAGRRLSKLVLLVDGSKPATSTRNAHTLGCTWRTTPWQEKRTWECFS